VSVLDRVALGALLAAGLCWTAPAMAATAVTVTSEPPGASILLDGQPTGHVTPATLTGVLAGSHQLVVQAACVSGKLDIDLVDDQTLSVAVPLVAQGGMLQLQLSPPSATVQLDGSVVTAVAGVPLAVDCGSHTLAVTADGYKTTLLGIDVDAGVLSTVPIQLDAIGTGTIALDVLPARATLWVDDRSVGRGSRQVQVDAGPHNLRAGIEGYLDEERQVLVEADQTLPVVFSLQPRPASSKIQTRKRHRWIGLSLVGAGVAGLGWGAVEYFQGAPGWSDFQDRKDKIESGLWPETYQDDPTQWAYDAYDDQVKGHHNRMLVADIAGGLLLSTGVVLSFAL